MIARRPAFIILVVLAAGGCQAPPINRSAIEDQGLSRISVRFEDVVEASHSQPDLDWHSGWIGNLWVNFWGKENLGLCYQWQEWVYQEVVDTVTNAGWEACGIAVNMETKHEHHAVVVFDPQRSSRELLLEAPDANPSFVLDAWRRGRPDIYTMTDWLTLPSRIEVRAELEQLPWHEDLNLPFREGDRESELSG